MCIHIHMLNFTAMCEEPPRAEPEIVARHIIDGCVSFKETEWLSQHSLGHQGFEVFSHGHVLRGTLRLLVQP